MVGVVMQDAEIDGLVTNLVVNGVEVMSYVEAELDRRHPVRQLIRSDEPGDLREAWRQLRDDWATTTGRVRSMPEKLCGMGNVNLPTPVALAGGAICALGGYLLGVVAGPDKAPQATATVVTYDAGSERICLAGDGVAGHGAKDGRLCGTWHRTDGAPTPREGDRFQSVTLRPDPEPGHHAVNWIYGDVLRSAR